MHLQAFITGVDSFQPGWFEPENSLNTPMSIPSILHLHLRVFFSLCKLKTRKSISTVVVLRQAVISHNTNKPLRYKSYITYSNNPHLSKSHSSDSRTEIKFQQLRKWQKWHITLQPLFCTEFSTQQSSVRFFLIWPLIRKTRNSITQHSKWFSAMNHIAMHIHLMQQSLRQLPILT